MLFYNHIDSDLSDEIKLFNTLFVHYVWIWPIIGRLIYLSKSFHFNYSFIRENLKGFALNFKMDLYRYKKFTEERNQYISKLVIFPFFGLFALFSVLTIIGKCISQEFECYFYSFNSLIFVVTKNCLNDTINKNIVLFLIIFKYSVDFLLQFFLLTMAYIITFKFKIKNDRFLIKTEVICLTVLWFLLDNFYHGFILFHQKFDEYLFSFSLNIILDFMFVILYFYLTFQRKKIDIKEFYVILNDYEMFIQNPIYFNYFREYIQKNYEDEEPCFIFWRRYNYYKLNFQNNNMIDNINLAYSIYSDCLYDQRMSTVIDKYSYAPSNIFSSDSSKKNSIVELPIEVYERIEEIVNNDFIIDDYGLYTLFDEAFQVINGKLYNRYLSMIRNTEEYEKLTKLFCYIEFDMSDHDHIKKEIPQIDKVLY